MPTTYAHLAAETSVPICVSETLATRYEYRAFLEQKACSVIMYDVTWCGGPSEAKKIADMADAYLIPTSPHTCGGPLLYICAAHLCTAVPNFLIMESNYWKYAHQFPYFINNVPAAGKRARHRRRRGRASAPRSSRRFSPTAMRWWKSWPGRSTPFRNYDDAIVQPGL